VTAECGLVIGSGPAPWPSPVALCAQGLRVDASRRGAPNSPGAKPTGSWAPEPRPRGSADLLEQPLVENASAYFGSAAVAHQHDYGLFDAQPSSRPHWLSAASRASALAYRLRPHQSATTRRESC